MMKWVKATKETMPNGEGPYLCSLIKVDGSRCTCYLPAYYDEENGFYFYIGSKKVSVGEDSGAKVTHWMPYPEPAED